MNNKTLTALIGGAGIALAAAFSIAEANKSEPEPKVPHSQSEALENCIEAGPKFGKNKDGVPAILCD